MTQQKTDSLTRTYGEAVARLAEAEIEWIALKDEEGEGEALDIYRKALHRTAPLRAQLKHRFTHEGGLSEVDAESRLDEIYSEARVSAGIDPIMPTYVLNILRAHRQSRLGRQADDGKKDS